MTGGRPIAIVRKGDPEYGDLALGPATPDAALLR